MASAASATATKTILRFFRWPAMNEDAARRLAAEASESGLDIDGFESEFCFNVEVEVATGDAAPPVTDAHYAVLRWLFTETFEPSQTSSQSGFSSDNASMIVEVGPRMAFSTAWSSNAVSICHACGLTSLPRGTVAPLSDQVRHQLSLLPPPRAYLTLLHRPRAHLVAHNRPGEPLMIVPALLSLHWCTIA